MPYLRANYKRIHYADWPSTTTTGPSKPPILLIHGLGSSQNYYTALIPHLTAQSHHCIALDTTGQGRSPYTHVAQTLHSLALDIVSAMDALDIPKAIIVGHSMAGLTMPVLASTYPDRVVGVCLLGPVYPDPGSVPVFEQRIEKVEKEGMQSMADTVPAAAVGSKASALCKAFIRELLMASQAEGYVSLCRVIVNTAREGGERPNYGGVRCPLFIVAGMEDKSAPVAACERVLREVGTEEGKKSMVVLETGHWMAVEAPDEVGRRIAEWVGGLP